MRGLLIAVALVAALLIATNPSRAEFNTWAQTWVVQKIEDEARRRGENPNDGASQLGGTIAGIFLPHLPIERQNFLAFSIYSLDLPEGDGRERRCSVLGVAGQFVPLGDC
jgi:hypothetical protein